MEVKIIIKMNVRNFFPGNPFHTDSPLVYRVNWLRARAQRNRWAEEVNLTKHEMQWTVRWYVHMATKWKARRDAAADLSRGHVAYAEKQIAMWNELGRVSDLMFTNSNSHHTSVWQLVV